MDGFQAILNPTADDGADLDCRAATALSGGGSVLVTGPSGTAALLASTARRLVGSRISLLRVRPPLNLSAFLGQLGQGTPSLADDWLEEGFQALTVPSPGCDRIALLVEDAHLLPHESLRYLDFATQAVPHLHIGFFGQAGIADTLALAGFSRLRQHVMMHLTVPEAAPPVLPVADPQPPIIRRATPRRVQMATATLVAAGAVAAGIALVAMLPRPVKPAVQEAFRADILAELRAPSSGAAAALSAADQDVRDAALQPEAAAAASAKPAVPALPVLPGADGAAPDNNPPSEPHLPYAGLAQASVAEPPLSSDSPPQPQVLQTEPTPAPGPASQSQPVRADAAALVEGRPMWELAVPEPVPVLPVPAPLTQDQAGGNAPKALAFAQPAAPLPSAPAVQPAAPVRPEPPRSQGHALPVPAHPAPVRPERAASRLTGPTPGERRCQSIIIHVQLGEAPTDDDQIFLRNGCH